MPRQPALLIVLDRTSRTPLQTQLALNLKSLVRSGVLHPGKALPSTRELARDLQISRNTVIQAYDRLIGEGYLEASVRRGIFVAEVLSERHSWRVTTSSQCNASLPQESSQQLVEPVPFRPCQPDVRLFPLPQWNRLRVRTLKRYGDKLLHYQSHSPLGFPGLRRNVAVYLRESRGVQCDWRQIAITAGSQQALYLLAQLLLKPGSRVLMEDPGYLGARHAWKQVGARLVPAPIDVEGVRLPSRRQIVADLVYTTPSRQFPIGACLSLSRRLALVDFAAKTKTWIVEDDYDSEFRYSRPPLPSLQSLDPAGRVIYVGSMSKVLFPSLRIGYVVLPVQLVEKFTALRSALDEHGPLIDQATLAEFIEEGALSTHIRRCRKEYARRLDSLVESAASTGLPLSFPHTDGGMNLTGFLEQGISDTKCANQLQERGLDVRSLTQYSLRPTRPGLVFGFTAFEPRTIRQSIEKTALALEALRFPGKRAP